MIELYPSEKISIDPHALRERLLVCAKDQAGNLAIMGWEKYLSKKLKQPKGLTRAKSRGEAVFSNARTIPRP